MKKLKRELRELYLENSERLELDLSDRRISSLDEILTELLQFQKIKSLNLSKNRLQKLPPDLGRLEQLEILNLEKNDFESSEGSSILPALKSLPKLTHLFISVTSELEDELISSLPKLQTFNGARFYLSEYSDTQSRTTADLGSEEPIGLVDGGGVSDSMPQFGPNDPDYNNLMELFVEVNNWTRKSEDFVTVVKQRKNGVGVLNHCMNEVIQWFSPGDKETPKILSLLKKNYNNLVQREAQGRQQAEFLLSESEKAKRELHLTFETLEQQYVNEIAELRTQLEREKHRQKATNMKLFSKPLLQTFVTPREMLLKNLQVTRKNSEKLRQSPIKKKRAGFFKNISYTKLHDMVNDIYKSKEKYDLVCRKNRLPRLTMERFFYFYLNQKFGIKSVVMEWSRSIQRGIKKFQEMSNDVKLFGMIMKNEVDEEFRYVQKQLKETVCELLKAYLKEKLPMKREREIKGLLKRKTKGFVYEEEWVDIIRYMYNRQDSKKVIRNVREKIRNMSDEIRVSDYKIKYEYFVQVLLNFQLAGHVNFLADFLRIFRQIDRDKDGIINEYEFVELIRMVNGDRNEREVRTMLKKIDPFENNQITYSECISFLSSEDGKKELIRMMNEKQRKLKRKRLDRQLKSLEGRRMGGEEEGEYDDDDDDEGLHDSSLAKGLLDDDDEDDEDEEEEEGESDLEDSDEDEDDVGENKDDGNDDDSRDVENDEEDEEDGN